MLYQKQSICKLTWMLLTIRIGFIFKQEDVSEDDIDAYIVVFSVNDRVTFEMAVEILFQIRHELCSEKAVILVANKIDIVRKRVISSDGMWTTKQRNGSEANLVKG